MKKIFLLLITLSLFLTACPKKQAEIEALSLPVRVSVAGADGKSGFAVTITQNGWTASFNQGHPLFGTAVEIVNGQGRAEVLDFSRPVSADIFPAQNALAAAIKGICEGKSKPARAEGQLKYTIDEMRIMVYYNNDNGKVIGIETEEGGRRFYFDVIALEHYEEPSNGEG